MSGMSGMSEACRSCTPPARTTAGGAGAAAGEGHQARVPGEIGRPLQAFETGGLPEAASTWAWARRVACCCKGQAAGAHGRRRGRRKRRGGMMHKRRLKRLAALLPLVPHCVPMAHPTVQCSNSGGGGCAWAASCAPPLARLPSEQLGLLLTLWPIACLQLEQQGAPPPRSSQANDGQAEAEAAGGPGPRPSHRLGSAAGA